MKDVKIAKVAFLSDRAKLTHTSGRATHLAAAVEAPGCADQWSLIGFPQSWIRLPSMPAITGSPELQNRHGVPAPHPQASARLLNSAHGRSRWYAQTKPVESHTAQR
jgi:hypothetical protein